MTVPPPPISLRRRSILGAAAASLVSAASPTFARGNPAWLKNMGVNAFGLRRHLIADFAWTLARLRDIGIWRLELVSFRGWSGHPYGDFKELAGMTGQAVAQALAAAGLTADSSHVQPSELTPDALNQTLEWMAPIGVRTLVLAGLQMGTAASEARARAIEGLNATGEKLLRRGFNLMLHGDFALWEFDGRERFFARFVRSVDPSLCRLQLDLGATLQMSVDAAAILREHGRHIGSLHLRDGKPPFDPEVYLPSVALGEGAAPIPAIMRAALRAGVDDFVLKMVMRPEGGEIEALARSKSYLEQFQRGEATG